MFALPATAPVSHPPAGGWMKNNRFLTINLETVEDHYKRWMTAWSSSIKPFYAVKCNDDPAILKRLALLGSHFDCASADEIQQLLELGISANRILFANTCKLPYDLHYASSVGIRQMTADSVYELDKIARHFGSESAEIIIRIDCVGDPEATIPFGHKFGAPRQQWPELLQRLRELDLALVGVSFHVGSGSKNISAYLDALHQCRDFITLATSEPYGYTPTIIDIGGGFTSPLTDGLVSELSQTLRTLFPRPHFTYIAEPGRYFVERCASLYTKIIGKKRTPRGFDYTLYESIYGLFADVAHGYMTPVPQIVDTSSLEENKTYPTTLYGATCDGSDIILKGAQLPELAIGDWLRFDNMGAYTTVLATRFNKMGFESIPVYYCSGRLFIPRSRSATLLATDATNKKENAIRKDNDSEESFYDAETDGTSVADTANGR